MSSVRIQEAFKVALSLTLFYWLALAMDWDLPKYGALAIVLIGLGTAGASIQKGVLRVVGTTVGLVVGLLSLALFAQDRWLTLVFLSGYLVFVSYHLQASRVPYAWFVAGFLPPLVWSATYGDVDQAFHFATFRYLETTAGVVIHTLVTLLVWPRYDKDAGASSDAFPGFRALLGLGGGAAADKKTPVSTGIDHARLARAFFPPACFAAGFTFWILTDPPTGPSVPKMASVFSLLILMTPMSAVRMLMTMLVVTWVAIAPIYFFVMPRLDTGLALLALVFLYSFLVGWLGAGKPIVKLLLLVLFVMLTGISNDQTYSFLGLANGATLFALSLTIIAVVQTLSASFRRDDGAEARFAV
jgi:uncharacterized membrane protein YccC